MIPIIDTHVHVWNVEKLQYPWLDSFPSINKNYDASDYRHATENCSITQVVVVQGECLPEQYLDELEYIQQQIVDDSRISGVVAYAPVEDAQQFDKALHKFSINPLVKGVRRMYDDDPAICTGATFINGLHKLGEVGLSFDISIHPHAMPETIAMIKKCPGTSFILDHLGKPGIRTGSFDVFQSSMDTLSQFPNVKAKISGLVTEADHDNWTTEDIEPYITYALKKFGFERLMYGSDFPVVLLASSYEKWLTTVMEIVLPYGEDKANAFFSKTARDTYRLTNT